MGYDGANPLSVEATSMAAFNHSLQECWYYNKHGIFQSGLGTVISMKTDCEQLYEAGIDPRNITTDDSGYVCYGQYGPEDPYDGYVGRCWEPASTGDPLVCTPRDCDGEPEESGAAEICVGGVVKYCSGNYNANQDTCNKPWLVKQDCEGGGSVLIDGWTDDDGDGGYACVEKAIKDYCGIIEIPQVIDPSDAADDTGEIWNAPAVLIDSGVVSQLNEPLAVLKGRIAQAAAPSGLIQQYADKIRMGAMIFNDDGSLSECSQTDPSILYGCADAANRDGGRIISYIDQSGAHTTDLIAAVNAIKATSWTPLAEAMFNAIGYYTQTGDLRLNAADFLIDNTHNPITAWCQNNNILIITEGASTADLNSTVSSFAASAASHDGDTEASSCGTLDGSTLLDDLTHYGWRGTDIFGVGSTNQNIMTHLVIAGTSRAGGTGECDPATLLNDAAINGGTTVYQANSPNELQAKLESAFATIRKGAAAGSAASVISASRGGEGAIYQAIFWPRVDINNADPVDWIGEVHSLHIDAYGNMFEDTNGNRTLDAADQQVVFYYDEQAQKTKACVGPSDPAVICSGTSKNMDEIHYLWSGSQWLAEITDGDIVLNRDAATNYISNDKKRYIFTWNDLDNNGSVADGEILDFASQDWTGLTVGANRGPVPMDFGVGTSDKVNVIVNWVRGLDQTGLRQRQLPYDFDLDGTTETVTWRLGDVVHSTPIAVSKPAEGYHFIYRDQSYGLFAARYNNRRHVIYFGANDGMLHAVNGGFYGETQKKFCLTPDCNNETTAPALGAELWAYVPYNLLPHLKCLIDPNYDHKYFVDLKPRIFDVQIFDDDSLTTNIHPGGWGTILVAGMRFGGARISASELDTADNGIQDHPGDTRQFTSAYFILDITNPEQKPVLLGELTFENSSSQDLGFSTAMPTVIPMKTGSNTSEWYLAFGSGPTTIDGTSDQQASIAVFPLEKLLESPRAALRIPAAAPTGSNEAGRFLLAANSFVSDLITVDYDLVENYRADVVYFGTVEGTWGNWGGKVYRLVTHKEDETGQETASKPSDWSNLLSSASPLANPQPLIDVGRPVTAAPAIAWDGEYRWVYFGTGRFLDADDKTDSSSNAQETYYGIREPQDCDGNLTWATVLKEPATPSTTPGDRGLLQVDQILVHESNTMVGATLSCIGGGDTCLPEVNGSKIISFDQLVLHIAGDGCDAGAPTGIDGWYKELSDPRERNLGQATVLGGLLTFTTYQPWEDVCLPEGLAFLYGSYYRTGTAWYESVFTASANGGVVGDDVVDRLAIGRGLALTPNLHVGRQVGNTAFVQTSTGAIVEIPQTNLPIKSSKSGKTKWDERNEINWDEINN
jgi:type IV pilus assembly protein PilY1